MMIPDEPFNFNHAGAFSNFGDQEVRLRHLLRQHALPTVESGSHLLYACPICKHPWYKADSCEYPRLTLEQLAFLGAALHTDVHALHLLPKALCPICSTIYLGGMFSFGEYPHHRGYHFLWESASPRQIRLLAMVCRSEGLTLDLLVQMSPTTRTCTPVAWVCLGGELPSAWRQCAGLAGGRSPPAGSIPVCQLAHRLARTGASHAHGAVRRRAHDHHFTDHQAGKSDLPPIALRPGRCCRAWGTPAGLLSHPWQRPSTLSLD